MDADTWTRARNFLHSDFSVALLAERPFSVSVCVPTLNEAETVGPIVSCLADLRSRAVIDEVLVVDGGSRDRTVDEARRHGASVHMQESLQSEFGRVLGKGDAMWRALSVAQGDVICFVDGDLKEFSDEYIIGLVSPLVLHEEVAFVKSTFDRPFMVDEGIIDQEAGRVTQMAARPLIDAFFPDLSGFRQPLSGQIAGRRSLLASLPFSTGYAVDIGLLIDSYQHVGLDAIAQVDIGTILNRHHGVTQLSLMATDVVEAVAQRLERDGRLAERATFIDSTADGLAEKNRVVERPALQTVL